MIHSQLCQENCPLVTYPSFLVKNYQIYLPFWFKCKTLKARMIIYLKSSLSSHVAKPFKLLELRTECNKHIHTETLCTDLPEQNMHGSEAPEIDTRLIHYYTKVPWSKMATQGVLRSHLVFICAPHFKIISSSIPHHMLWLCFTRFCPLLQPKYYWVYSYCTKQFHMGRNWYSSVSHSVMSDSL